MVDVAMRLRASSPHWHALRFSTSASYRRLRGSCQNLISLINCSLLPLDCSSMAFSSWKHRLGVLLCPDKQLHAWSLLMLVLHPSLCHYARHRCRSIRLSLLFPSMERCSAFALIAPSPSPSLPPVDRSLHCAIHGILCLLCHGSSTHTETTQ